MGSLGRLLTLRFGGINGVRTIHPLYFGRIRTPIIVSRVLCSSLPPPPVIKVQYSHGRPVLQLLLPSRGEACRFPLRPMTMTVAHFLSDIQKEDPGVTTAAILTTDGEKMSTNTLLDSVLSKNFQLVINDTTYSVISASNDMCHEHLTGLEDVKMVVHMLYSALHLPEHQRLTERQLLERLDGLKQQLQPLEKDRAGMEARAEVESMRYVWGGLAFMSLQAGFLGYLTWNVFSWDVMEPVTFFITYTWSMGLMAYFILTQQGYSSAQTPVSVAGQEFMYADAKARHFLTSLHQVAAKEGFNITQYNELKEEVAKVESDLRRLRNPIKLQLPVEQVQR
ncbi:calcium uniporter regulatory subunit MCUb, mitochondrial-like isoform X2 [Clupea harengus]|uniref:Calcium uniporter protein n=1 Tax=Clupea harengus TaxID=7950 RepID=A0A6P8GQE2_CLUHA|nr:calcium uniporter regulatory subunit MCUb, mitochondrial-like isoform X2 [Clupea harengus]